MLYARSDSEGEYLNIEFPEYCYCCNTLWHVMPEILKSNFRNKVEEPYTLPSLHSHKLAYSFGFGNIFYKYNFIDRCTKVVH